MRVRVPKPRRTFLEMDEPSEPVPVPPSPLRLQRWDPVQADRYRALFRRVGESDPRHLRFSA